MRPLNCVLLMGMTLLWGSEAWGYCRLTTCSASVNPPAECLDSSTLVDECQTAGAPLYWAKTCLSFSVQYEGSAKLGISGHDLERTIRAAFNNWQGVECPGGGSPELRVDTFPMVSCKEQRYNPDGANQNVWFFQDEVWPYDDDRSEDIAVTTSIFNSFTGEMYDADVALNSANNEFVLDGAPGKTDLMSIVQHESGHVLGLADLRGPAHNPAGTMYSDYKEGVTSWRNLDTDAIAGVCEGFPPSPRPHLSCDATPRQGFTTQCYRGKSGCTLAPGENPKNTLWTLVLVFGSARRYRHWRGNLSFSGTIGRLRHLLLPLSTQTD